MKQKSIIGLIMILIPVLSYLFLPFLIREPKVYFSSTQTIGSSTFPILILSVMLLCGLIIFIESLLNIGVDNNSPIVVEEWLTMIKIAFISLLYAVGMPRIGYFVSTIVCLILGFWVFEKNKVNKLHLVRFFINALIVSILLYVVFVIILRVPVPEGLLI
ncbi:MAG: tripartite tricarboxylate transporter TctB family protein [Peptococcales bacterium]